MDSGPTPPNLEHVYEASGEFWAECPIPGCLFVSEKFISRVVAQLDLDSHECYFTK